MYRSSVYTSRANFGSPRLPAIEEHHEVEKRNGRVLYIYYSDCRGNAPHRWETP